METINHSKKSSTDPKKNIDRLFFGFLKKNKLYTSFRLNNKLNERYFEIKKYINGLRGNGGLALLFNQVYLTGHMKTRDRLMLSQKFRIFLLDNINIVKTLFNDNENEAIESIIAVMEKNYINRKISILISSYKNNKKLIINKNYDYYFT